MLLKIALAVVAAALSLNAKCKPAFESVCSPDASPEESFTSQKPKFSLEQPKWTSPYRLAQFSMIGAAAADIASSWGCGEANPILRSADGRFRAQGLVIKAGVTASGLVASHLLRKRYPKLEKPLTFLMGGTSTYLYATALHNHSMPCH